MTFYHKRILAFFLTASVLTVAGCDFISKKETASPPPQEKLISEVKAPPAPQKAVTAAQTYLSYQKDCRDFNLLKKGECGQCPNQRRPGNKDYADRDNTPKLAERLAIGLI